MQTHFDFVLPRGYVDPAGTVHRFGRMRLATARDEVESLQDPRVLANEAYLPLVLLARVIVQLGQLTTITPAVMEAMFAADLAYLEDLYEHLNSPEQVILSTVCPHCHQHFQVEVAPLG